MWCHVFPQIVHFNVTHLAASSVCVPKSASENLPSESNMKSPFPCLFLIGTADRYFPGLCYQRDVRMGLEFNWSLGVAVC